jgi:hypothetical protein
MTADADRFMSLWCCPSGDSQETTETDGVQLFDLSKIWCSVGVLHAKIGSNLLSTRRYLSVRMG